MGYRGKRWKVKRYKEGQRDSERVNTEKGYRDSVEGASERAENGSSRNEPLFISTHTVRPLLMQTHTVDGVENPHTLKQ